MERFFACIFFYLLTLTLVAQEVTVGVLSHEGPSDGYNLLYPHNQSSVFLIDNCGRIVHEWKDDSRFRPGNVAYILDDGSLVKAKRPVQSSGSFGAGGSGGIIEWRSWDNAHLNTVTIMDTLYRAHHDLAVLPNGNVLAIVWERKSLEEVFFFGGDSIYHQVSERWPDMIVEINKNSGDIVWEWHAWNHLIQDYDESKPNYGVIEEHPGRININADLGEFGLKPDWMHFNSIDYNPELDQILISVPHFNEIWIIDHSTTTEEARTSSGGRYGKGGDLLYRWGNPQMYDMGSDIDQKAYFQHDARWVTVEDSPYFGMVSFFNNRVTKDSSNAAIINPRWDGLSQSYPLEDGLFSPDEIEKVVTHPSERIFSSGLSSAQVLANDNFLITVGREGYVFEITPDNQLVWEYKVPLLSGEPVSQGSHLVTNDNLLFRMNRYPNSYAAFEGRELKPMGTIELNGIQGSCITTSSTDLSKSGSRFAIYPNPSDDYIFISGISNVDVISIYDLSGQLWFTSKVVQNEPLSIEMLPEGIYIAVSNKRSQLFAVIRD